MAVICRQKHILNSIDTRIINSSFGIKPFTSGLIYQIITGVQRSEFASEAGLGTSAIGGSIDSNNPKSQSFIQMFGVYITNILVCLSSAVIIMLSPYQSIKLNNINGIELSLFAFSYHFGSSGITLLFIFVFLFSFSTILTCYYYSLVSLTFLIKRPKKFLISLLKVLVAFMSFVGLFLNSVKLWMVIDILVGFLVVINLYSIYKLKHEIM